jgi:hypothetical protein
MAQTKSEKVSFRLELRCACSPQLCAHAGPAVAKLLKAAYAKGRADGVNEAVQGISKAASKIGLKVQVERKQAGVRQQGSRRMQ